MIALLISGSQDEYGSIKSALSEKDYSVIHYTNFLKAFDNLDDINPDLIIISAQDYPRHWKIISFVAKYHMATKTIVLVNQDFTDKKDANFLSAYLFTYDTEENFNKSLFLEILKFSNTSSSEIQDTINTLDSSETITSTKINYDEYFDEEDFPAPTVEELLSHSANEYISTGSKCNFVYMNPSVMSIITGKVVSFIYPEICFIPDRKEGFQSIYIGQILDDCSLKTEIGLSSVKTCVTDVSDTITMHIC
ncbi:MAG: hypothetical protein K5751_07745 [Treponemataceae bacterium]|nr:hypothetical protein [Treponemataceae bacterium]